METNPFNTDNVRFSFAADSATAQMRYTARESWDLAFTIGLDGVYRTTETTLGPVAAKGRWRSPTTFELDVEIIGYSTFDRWEFTFTDAGVQVVEHSISGMFEYAGAAAAPEP